MPEFAFSGGVRPGGLTSTTEIRVLLCYILARVPRPMSFGELESVLVGQELVNYYEFANALAALEEKGLVVCQDSLYSVTDTGRAAADTLAHDVPLTVREQAVATAVAAQRYALKAAEYGAEVVSLPDGGFEVRCRIGDSRGEVFRLALYMPDALTAEKVKDRFVHGADALYSHLLELLTAPPGDGEGQP